MLKYSASISTIMSDRSLRERLRKISDAGLNAFEFLFVSSFGLSELIEGKDEFGLQVTVFDPEAGDTAFTKGYGYLGTPDAGEVSRRSLDDALENARLLGCGRLNCLTGMAIPGLGWERQRDLVVERLQQAATSARDAGVTLLVEAISPMAVPGYLVNYSRQALEIVDLVAQPNVRFQIDLYHTQMLEGNLITTLRNNIDRLGHVQIADVPGRHEPGTGEVNFVNVLRALDNMGYNGYVGLEYVPISDAPFAWLDDLPVDDVFFRAA
jgi:hydroxypyruvate isomerase